MIEYLKKFESHTAYEAFTGTTAFTRPNVSYCIQENEVHYNAYVPPLPPETRVVAKYNVTDTSNPTRIASATTGFSSIEIDGVTQQSVTTGYTFSTTGEHTVKYAVKNATIGEQAFNSCTSITSVTIPDSVTSIGDSAFENCSGLTSVTIPSDVTIIGESAFLNCYSLTSINIPNGVTRINGAVLANCRSLTSVTIPDSVISIEETALQGCSNLSSITIPNSVTYIGMYSFYYCSGLTNIVIPDSVLDIDEYAFGYCSGLTSCTIGSGIESIGNRSFNGCTSLTRITCNAMTAPTVVCESFEGVGINGRLYVPQGSTGYDIWLSDEDCNLEPYNWTKVEQ